MDSGDLKSTLANISKRQLEMLIALQDHREEINAVATVLSGLGPQMRGVLEKQVAIERERGDAYRETLRQRIRVLDLLLKDQVETVN